MWSKIRIRLSLKDQTEVLIAEKASQNPWLTAKDLQEDLALQFICLEDTNKKKKQKQN